MTRRQPALDAGPRDSRRAAVRPIHPYESNARALRHLMENQNEARCETEVARYVTIPRKT